MSDYTANLEMHPRTTPASGHAPLVPVASILGASSVWLVGTAQQQPTAWTIMWILAATLFFLAKATSLRSTCARASLWEALAYVLLWPGLNPDAFIKRTNIPPTREWLRQMVAGVLNLTAGLGAMTAAVCLISPGSIQAWTAMTGVVLALHHGLFQLLSAFWVARGRCVHPIMNMPIAARSVGEFWNRRWNIAFRDWMTSLVFRPAARRWGVRTASLLVFLASGLLHEIVISVPAGGGYGLPTLYFVLQAAAVRIERRFGTAVPGWIHRVWTWIALIGPLPLLFHRPFIDVVILPFLQSLTEFLP